MIDTKKTTEKPVDIICMLTSIDNLFTFLNCVIVRNECGISRFPIEFDSQSVHFILRLVLLTERMSSNEYTTVILQL